MQWTGRARIFCALVLRSIQALDSRHTQWIALECVGYRGTLRSEWQRRRKNWRIILEKKEAKAGW